MTNKDITLTANSSWTFADVPDHTRTSVINIAILMAKKDARLHFECETAGSLK
jgi:hypothetical protein